MLTNMELALIIALSFIAFMVICTITYAATKLAIIIWEYCTGKNIENCFPNWNKE